MPIRELLLKDADTRDLTQLSEYEAAGGYRSLRKALGMERKAVLDELLEANIRGRGGAGFPMGRRKRRSRSTSSSMPTSPSPGRSRTARSCSASRISSSRA